MSSIVRLVAIFGFVAVVAACTNRQDEFVVVDPEPISTEPVFTGKYK